MRLYLEVARRGFRQHAAYRGATFGGLFTNTVFGFMRSYILLAVYRTRTDVGGFDAVDAVTYVWLGQGMLMVIYMWGWWPIAERIRSGDIAIDLYRPVDLQWYWLAHDLGRSFYHLMFRGVLPIAIGALVFDLRWPPDVPTALAFVASLVLAAAISFAFRFILNCSAFWFLDWRGAGYIGALVMNLFSGFIIPLTFFPGPLEAVSRALPFAFMLEVPVEIFLGKFGPADLLAVMAGGVAWLVVLLVLGRVMLARAVQKLVVQGG